MREIGFGTRKRSPRRFYNEEWDICDMVYGDDFVVVGNDEFLNRVADARETPSVKAAVLGPTK